MVATSTRPDSDSDLSAAMDVASRRMEAMTPTRFSVWKMKELRALDAVLIEVRSIHAAKLHDVYNELHEEIRRRVARNRT